MEVGIVIKKLRAEEYEVVPCESRGAIWRNFYKIVDSESRTPVEWVQCKVCFKIYKYQTKSGTSHLLRHKCHVASTSADSPSQSTTEEIKLTSEQHKIIIKACVWYCAKDLRSFHSISGDSFKQFLRTVFNVRDECGNVPVEDMLPHPTTISRHIVDEATELRYKILPELLEAVQNGNCAGTMDLWTDNNTKINFYTVTLQYADETWKIIQRVLFTADFPEEKSAVDVRSDLLRRFDEFGIPQDIISNITFVTDQESNIVEALENYRRLNCIAHFIQSSLRNAFKKHVRLNGDVNAFATFEACRNLVAYLKRSGYVTRLPLSVHEESDTRWNSEINMLRSVVNQYDDIVQVLLDVNEIHRLNNYDAEAANALLEFLHPFEEAITKLQVGKSPTLHLVILWVYKLILHCQPEEHDSLEMEYIKNEVGRYLKQKFVADKTHKIATFLSPSCRKLKMLSEEEKADVMQDISDLISGGKSTERAVASTSNRSKLCKVDFPEWQDFTDCPESYDEVDTYMNIKSYQPDDDLLQWWRTKRDLMPTLAGLAKKIFSVPATSVASERNFSAAGFVAQERRSRLKPATIDGLLFLHNNLPFD